MKNHVFLISLLTIFVCLRIPTALTTKAATVTPTKILSYKIVDIHKVQLILSGSQYTDNAKKCLIRKENDNFNGFTQINPCNGHDGTGGTDKCVRPCSADNNELAFNILSPRTKYIYVYSGEHASVIKEKNNGGEVFGLSIPLLVNPKIAISTEASTGELKLSATTYDRVDCPIYYNGIEYATGTKGDDCVSENKENKVNFDLMIPQYEMICTNYPSFFYRMPNTYMKQNIDIYKPQYYVSYKSGVTAKTSYVLKFTNAFPSEICLFSIKDAATGGSSPTNTYASACGGAAGKKCYAPCNNVELTLVESKPIVTILIETRNYNLQSPAGSFQGYVESKYAIDETSPNTLMTSSTAVGKTLNLPLYSPSSASVKFETCSLKFFAAGKPRTTGGLPTQCAGSSPCSGSCTSSVIQGLDAGKAYVIEITPTGISNPEGFKEYLFFTTEKSSTLSFIETKPVATDVAANVKAVADSVGTQKSEPTCSYYVSIAGKNAFEDAECEDSVPCRGFCKETKKLINLNPKTNYDIKVISQKDYGIKLFTNIPTSWSSLALSHHFVDKGFEVIGVLTSSYPKAICRYKIKVKKGSTFDDVYSCPAVASSSSQTTQQTNNPVQSLMHSKSQTSRHTHLIFKSNLSLVKVATSSNSGSGASSGSNNPTQSSTNQLKFPACDAPPLCSKITFSEGYEADKVYKILVSAEGRSEEVSIEIPKKSLPQHPINPNKQITVDFRRDGTTLHITSKLPKDKDDNSLCHWILIETSDVSHPVVKKCDTTGSNSCTPPTCKSFVIENVNDSNEYLLTLIHTQDPTIKGVRIIQIGETSSQSNANASMIIGVVVPIVIVVIAVGVYFGYRKNRE